MSNNKRGCCSAQLGCCFGGLGCRFCCGCLPRVYESTTTRLMYTLILFLGTAFMAFSLTPHTYLEKLEDLFPNIEETCKFLKVGDNCELLIGYMAVYRTAFILSGFFFVMALVTIGLKKSGSIRANIHNGAWIWKFLILIGIGVGVFSIPKERTDHFQLVWMYVALVGAVAFILIQLWLLVFFARSLGSKIDRQIDQGGNRCCWYAVSSLCTLMCYAIFFVGTVTLFFFFARWEWENCTTNKVFIGTNAALCVILTLLSVFACCGARDIHSSLLQSGIISVYITYLTWTAISAAPREAQPNPAPPLTDQSKDPQGKSMSNLDVTDQRFYCGPNDAEFAYNEFILPYVGVAIMFFTVVYSSIGTSSDKAVALGINVRRGSRDKSPRAVGCCCSSSPTGRRQGDAYDAKDDEDESGGGQLLLRNERHGTVYNYSLFHVVYCLASMFIMMTLTSWFKPQGSNLGTFNQSWATVWIKMGTSWACIVLYIIALPMRRFGQSAVADSAAGGSNNARTRITREIYERETVT